MTLKNFYRATLFLPIVAPLIISIFGKTSLGWWLTMSIFISGIEYIIFAIAMFYLIGKYRTDKKIRRLFWLSPPIFIVIAICGWYIGLYIDRLTNPSLIVSFDMVYIFLFYGLLIGYGYCLFFELIYRVFQSLGWISLDQHNK
ncbi:hypothetical protein TKWG_20940 [Advenella kashmirensis WT001]|uniref:Transmembrane protein n=1 Tax=Advenella kashmirensis (strain DSM 17095 / LMG 22695 / WT001) TaxID=1036672 RepID=I3UFW7_ADVKW|nr:hypothetical protein TKWG_20940 [Advenella kashmirensis WT001]